MRDGLLADAKRRAAGPFDASHGRCPARQARKGGTSHGRCPVWPATLAQFAAPTACTLRVFLSELERHEKRILGAVVADSRALRSTQLRLS
jgi:hypothetical protein